MPRPLDIPGLEIFGNKEALSTQYRVTFTENGGNLILAHLQLLYRQTPYWPILRGPMANEHLWFRAGKDEVVKDIENYMMGEFDPPMPDTYDTTGV